MKRLKEKHTPDLTSCNCLMTGLARLGDADGALKVFEEMEVEADDVSYKLAPTLDICKLFISFHRFSGGVSCVFPGGLRRLL